MIITDNITVILQVREQYTLYRYISLSLKLNKYQSFTLPRFAVSRSFIHWLSQAGKTFQLNWTSLEEEVLLHGQTK